MAPFSELPPIPFVDIPFSMTPRLPPEENGQKDDTGKLRYCLIDGDAEAEFVAVLSYGAIKYGDGNWAFVEDAEDRYYDALRRHTRAARGGELLDPESGLMHLACAECCIHFLLALSLRASPELVASLPERYRRAREVALRIKAEREAKKKQAAEAVGNPRLSTTRRKKSRRA